MATQPERAHETEQQLKQISILFLDAVGSTALSQRLDQEAISAVMDDALSRGTAIVEGLRGKVLQYAGDNIPAAFGVDEAREDDAERAVHCGAARRCSNLNDPYGTLPLQRQGRTAMPFSPLLHGACLA